MYLHMSHWALVITWFNIAIAAGHIATSSSNILIFFSLSPSRRKRLNESVDGDFVRHTLAHILNTHIYDIELELPAKLTQYAPQW